jgi:hypothetical protein
METKFISKLSHGLAIGAFSVDAGTLALVALAIRHDVITFDPDAANGKGQWKGTTSLVKSVLGATTELDMPRVESVFTKSKVNKAAVVLTALGGSAVHADDDSQVLNECKAILGARTLTSLYNELTTKDEGDKEDKFSLSGALATVVAAARKREIPDATIVETLMAILAGE